MPGMQCKVSPKLGKGNSLIQTSAASFCKSCWNKLMITSFF